MHTGVEIYIQSVPPERSERFRRLHALILELYPEADVDMQYKMPTYRVGEGWVALANQKHYISLYTCGEHHIAAFRKKHPKISTGKGCIRFRDSDPMPLAALKQVIRHAMRQNKRA